MYTLWSTLDEPLKTLINDRIENNNEGSSLLRLLRLIPNQPVEMPTSLLRMFMSFYNSIENVSYFRVCGQNTNVTLEDVLFLTHLSITGRPIVPINSKELQAFDRIFSIKKIKLSLLELRGICCDSSRNVDVRIKTILLMIVTCLICPNGNGQICYTSYVQYIENLEEVNSYAWGAAMLAYL
jgi:hypothetical protein